MTDRDVQDEIIRYLTEPLGRTSAALALALAPEQAARAGHFAQFLARRYYRDRLGRSFRYSAMAPEYAMTRSGASLASPDTTTRPPWQRQVTPACSSTGSALERVRTPTDSRCA